MDRTTAKPKMDAAAIAERITRLEGEIDELSKEIREEKKKRDATADDIFVFCFLFFAFL